MQTGKRTRQTHGEDKIIMNKKKFKAFKCVDCHADVARSSPGQKFCGTCAEKRHRARIKNPERLGNIIRHIALSKTRIELTQTSDIRGVAAIVATIYNPTRILEIAHREMNREDLAAGKNSMITEMRFWSALLGVELDVMF